MMLNRLSQSFAAWQDCLNALPFDRVASMFCCSAGLSQFFAAWLIAASNFWGKKGLSADPLAIIGVVAILFPFLILGIAIATGDCVGYVQTQPLSPGLAKLLLPFPSHGYALLGAVFTWGGLLGASGRNRAVKGHGSKDITRAFFGPCFFKLQHKVGVCKSCTDEEVAVCTHLLFDCTHNASSLSCRIHENQVAAGRMQAITENLQFGCFRHVNFVDPGNGSKHFLSNFTSSGGLL
eukprot:425662-Pelagomonas_calceolata.AAC.1